MVVQRIDTCGTRKVGRETVLAQQRIARAVNATINAQRILKWEKSRRNTFPSDFTNAHILLPHFVALLLILNQWALDLLTCLPGMARLKDNNYYDSACWRSQRIFSYLESKDKSFRIEFNVAKFLLLHATPS